jgi:DNA-binding XRE family transcriptional regulator
MPDYEHIGLMRKNRLIIIKKVNYTCEICGKKARYVHHKDGTRYNHDLSNLQALCGSCHRKVHSSLNFLNPPHKLTAKEIALNKYGIIEQIRALRNLTHDIIAAEIGFSKETLLSTIYGRTKPQARNKYKIEKWLNGQFLTSPNEPVTS